MIRIELEKVIKNGKKIVLDFIKIFIIKEKEEMLIVKKKLHTLIHSMVIKLTRTLQ